MITPTARLCRTENTVRSTSQLFAAGCKSKLPLETGNIFTANQKGLSVKHRTAELKRLAAQSRIVNPTFTPG